MAHLSDDETVAKMGHPAPIQMWATSLLEEGDGDPEIVGQAPV
jgi:hypothetical protein